MIRECVYRNGKARGPALPVLARGLTARGVLALSSRARNFAVHLVYAARCRASPAARMRRALNDRSARCQKKTRQAGFSHPAASRLMLVSPRLPLTGPFDIAVANCDGTNRLPSPNRVTPIRLRSGGVTSPVATRDSNATSLASQTSGGSSRAAGFFHRCARPARSATDGPRESRRRRTLQPGSRCESRHRRPSRSA